MGEDWSRALEKLQVANNIGLIDFQRTKLGSDDEDNSGGEGGAQSGSTGVKVTIRVRPFIKEEFERDGGRPVLCIHMPTKTRLELLHPDIPLKTFDFDRTYWSHAPFTAHSPHFATQEIIYKELGSTLLEHAIDGFNNCIFAYGQTASGKSHSVLGTNTPEGRGLLPRLVDGLFDHFQTLPKSCSCKCLVSFMEIYNEQIRDLLVNQDDACDNAERRPSMPDKPQLTVRQHPVMGTIIPGLREAAVGCREDVIDLIEYGVTVRTVGATAMNYSSSRSHCIFTFKTSITNTKGLARRSQTHLVDLAGSERLSRTKSTDARRREGVAINKSLSTLAQVIKALADNCCDTGKKKKESIPPFRNSKLTLVLKESLCGNSKTVMMAAISPSLADYDETLSTLKFAQSAKLVQTRAVVNEVSEAGMQKQLQQEINRLREELANTQKMRAEDAQVLSIQEQRLAEAEDMCQKFEMTWPELLAAEKLKKRRRMAVSDVSLSSIEGLRERYESEQNTRGSVTSRSSRKSGRSVKFSAQLTDNSSSSSSSSSSGDSQDEDSDVPELPVNRRRPSCVGSFGSICSANSNLGNTKSAMLLHFAAPHGQTNSRTSFDASNGLAVVGPASEELLQNEGMDVIACRALTLTEEFRELQALVSEAQGVLDAVSPALNPHVQLRAMVALSPLDLSQTKLVIVARRCQEYSAVDVADSDDGVSPMSPVDAALGCTAAEEWLLASELRGRLGWLQSNENDDEVVAEGSPDLWALSKDAWRRCASKSIRINSLHTNLADAQAQLAATRTELIAERKAVAELRTALSRCEAALERSPRPLRTPSVTGEIATPPPSADAAAGTALSITSIQHSRGVLGISTPSDSCTSTSFKDWSDFDNGGPCDLATACGRQTLRVRELSSAIATNYSEALEALDSLHASLTLPGHL